MSKRVARIGSVVLIVLTLCLSVAMAERRSVQGVVRMVMINGIALTAEDGQNYRFVLSEQTENPDAASIGVGRTVRVTYADAYRDGCEALLVALLENQGAASPAPASADDAPLTVSGTVVSLNGTLLSMIDSSRKAYEFDISGAIVAGGEDVEAGDVVEVAYADDDANAATDDANAADADADTNAAVGVLTALSVTFGGGTNASDPQTTVAPDALYDPNAVGVGLDDPNAEIPGAETLDTESPSTDSLYGEEAGLDDAAEDAALTDETL